MEGRWFRWKKCRGGDSESSGSLLWRLSEFLSSELVREDEWIDGGKGTCGALKKHRLDEKGGRNSTLDQCGMRKGEVKGRVRQWANWQSEKLAK